MTAQTNENNFLLPDSVTQIQPKHRSKTESNEVESPHQRETHTRVTFKSEVRNKVMFASAPVNLIKAGFTSRLSRTRLIV